MSLVVLMYHRVNDILEPSDLVVPTKKFEEQMCFLKKNYEVISINSIREALTNKQTNRLDGQNLAAGKVLLTFDDGYRDNYLNAYPILKRLGLSAAIFLITDMIGTDKKRQRYSHLPLPDMLRWEEVVQMAEAGINFGMHTHTHPHLPELSLQEQREEIDKSIQILTEHLGNLLSEHLFFAYPYGEYNQDTLKILKQLKIKFAFTVEAIINTTQTNYLELGRVGINGLDTIYDFSKKLKALFEQESRVR